MGYDGRIQADARHLPIADESVQMCVTSPPYFGLRDYGHAGQIGLEKTPQEYIQALREVFREVWRVLRPDGVLWVNIGDSYAGSGMTGGTKSKEVGERLERMFHGNRRDSVPGMKPKDLIGIPWMLAFALRDDGWYLRSDVIWSKPNPMPESVTDRPTRAHEYLFLLSKSERYYYDAAAIAEPSAYPDGPNSPQSIKSPHGQGFTRKAEARANGEGYYRSNGVAGTRGVGAPHQVRNKRSVWTVSTAPYPEAHYATFPPALIEPCILAGSKPGDFVLDPFFGSGTVGRVCEQYSRRWLGVDLGYQDLQEKRLHNLQKVLV